VVAAFGARDRRERRNGRLQGMANLSACPLRLLLHRLLLARDRIDAWMLEFCREFDPVATEVDNGSV